MSRKTHSKKYHRKTHSRPRSKKGSDACKKGFRKGNVNEEILTPTEILQCNAHFRDFLRKYPGMNHSNGPDGFSPSSTLPVHFERKALRVDCSIIGRDIFHFTYNHCGQVIIPQKLFKRCFILKHMNGVYYLALIAEWTIMSHEERWAVVVHFYGDYRRKYDGPVIQEITGCEAQRDVIEHIGTLIPPLMRTDGFYHVSFQFIDLQRIIRQVA